MNRSGFPRRILPPRSFRASSLTPALALRPSASGRATHGRRGANPAGRRPATACPTRFPVTAGHSVQGPERGWFFEAGSKEEAAYTSAETVSRYAQDRGAASAARGRSAPGEQR